MWNYIQTRGLHCTDQSQNWQGAFERLQCTQGYSYWQTKDSIINGVPMKSQEVVVTLPDEGLVDVALNRPVGWVGSMKWKTTP